MSRTGPQNTGRGRRDRPLPSFVVEKISGSVGEVSPADATPDSPLAAREIVVGILTNRRGDAKHVGYTRPQG